MLYVTKAQAARGGWAWTIGRVALATSYLTNSAPGLFFFSISGVHRQGAELFSTHPRAEALLRRHLGCEVTIGNRAIAQSITVARDDRWHKLGHTDAPERESDTYTYTVGNVLLASLTNIKSIRENGYHLHLPLAAGPSTTRVLSIHEGEQELIRALACEVAILPRTASYFVGANHQPCDASWFARQPTLYDGRPAS